MKPIPTPIVPALVAVQSWKHAELVQMQAAILRHALEHGTVYPGDIPEDTVSEDSRQGVASNGFNVLTALEIIGRLPLTHNDPPAGIFAGRKRNDNPKAKGRWTAVYRLANAGLARAWLVRNGCNVRMVQAELI